MHFLLCIYFRKMWSHAVSMESSLLLDFSFYCSFGKKKSVWFLLSILLSWIPEQSWVLCPRWEQVTRWNPEENPLMPCWENGKLSWMCWFLKTPHIQIWQQTNKRNACTEALSPLDLLSSLKFLWVQWDVCSQGFSLAFSWWELLRSRTLLPPLQFCCFLCQMHHRHSPGFVISLNSWDLTHKFTSPAVNKEGVEVCIF